MYFKSLQLKQKMKAEGLDVHDTGNLLDEGDEDLLF